MMTRFALVLGLLAGPALAERIDLDGLRGDWRGAGEVKTVSTGDAQELRCRVTIEPHDGNTRFRGRCASTAGNRRFSMAIVEDGNTVTARSLLQGDANRDTTITGQNTSGGLRLTGANGNAFGLSESGAGGLALTLAFTENGERYEGLVTLSR